jgi:hypothetical protein
MRWMRLGTARFQGLWKLQGRSTLAKSCGAGEALELLMATSRRIPTTLEAGELVREGKVFVAEILPAAEGENAGLTLYNVDPAGYRIGGTFVDEQGIVTNMPGPETYACVALISFNNPEGGPLPTAAYFIKTLEVRKSMALNDLLLRTQGSSRIPMG